MNQITKQATVVSLSAPNSSQQMEQVAFFSTTGAPLFFVPTQFTQMPVQAASTAPDVATLVTNFNSLLTKLKTAGFMASA